MFLKSTSSLLRSLFLGQFGDDGDGTLEFVLLFRSGLNLALGTTAPIGGTVPPLKFVTSPEDHGVKPIDVLASRRLLGGQFLQDTVQLIDEGCGRRILANLLGLCVREAGGS